MFSLLKLYIIRENAVPVEGTIDWDEERQPAHYFICILLFWFNLRKNALFIANLKIEWRNSPFWPGPADPQLRGTGRGGAYLPS